jgi:hypothetical protein
MEVLKKKYMYVQTYSGNYSMEKDTLLGFHHGCASDFNNTLIENMMPHGLYPHYGFSFYENPPGRIIRKGSGRRPTFYRSNRLFNLGVGSLVKAIESSDMFSDYGLGHYRNVSFLMFMGKSERLFLDIQPFLCGDEPFSDHPMIQFFSGRAGIPLNQERDLPDELSEHHAILEEVGNLEFDSESGYADSVYLMSHVMTSLVLSHVTIRQLIEVSPQGLTELVQIPIMTEDYKHMLSSVFKYDETQCHVMTWNNGDIPLCAITPGIFGYEGALLDVAKRTVTGKRADVVRFLLYLNKKKVLDSLDLNYLV